MQKWAKFVIAAAVFGAAISLYQWVELHNVRLSGATPACAVNETVNCTEVWNSPLSNSLHNITGIPFPGWGLIWSGIVIALAFPLLLGISDAKAAMRVGAIRLTSGVGALIAVSLFIYSLSIGVVCPTCLLFYLAVFTTALLAFLALKPSTSIEWMFSGLHSAGWLVAGVLLLIYPGMQTPKHVTALNTVAPPTTPATSPQPGDDTLTQFIDSLPPEGKQALSDTLAMYAQNQPKPRSPAANRITFGNQPAPVHIMEWVDIRCPHCRDLHLALKEIAQFTPMGSWSLESRNYPLDSACNPGMQRSDGTGVRCLAAKLLICSTNDPVLRDNLFRNQESLSVDKIWELVNIDGDDQQRSTLEACVNSDQTSTQLAEDIRIAEEFDIHGTPLVVVNGREAPAFPALIYALILTGGDAKHPAFNALPAPNPPPPHEH